MTKKEKNNLLLIGAAAVAIWYFLRKKKPAARMLNTEQPIITAGENMQRAVDNTNFIQASESDAKQYKKDISQCAI